MQEKYAALAEIYEAYENKLEALGLKDHRDGLFLLQRGKGVRDAFTSRFRHLFIDGFFDFSESQLEFLSWLTKRSDRITLTLSADLSPERSSLFTIPRQTLEDLKKLGFEVTDLSQKENKRATSAELRHVEKNLFSPQSTVRSSLRDNNPVEAEAIPEIASASLGTAPRNDDRTVGCGQNKFFST